MTPLEMNVVLSKCTYKNWKLRGGVDTAKNNAMYIEWRVPVTDVKTGKPGTLVTERPRRYLWDGITESDLVRLAYRTALETEMHECGEHFLYEGQRIFDPHRDVRDFMVPKGRLMASRCEHGIPFAKECPECYRLYEADEGTRQ